MWLRYLIIARCVIKVTLNKPLYEYKGQALRLKIVNEVSLSKKLGRGHEKAF